MTVDAIVGRRGPPVEVDAVEKPVIVRKIIKKKPTIINSEEIINKYS